METLNLNVNLENLTNEEREALMKLVEKSQEKKSKVWKPENFYIYYRLSDFGEVLPKSWCDNYNDNEAYEINNVFRTKEEAEEELTRRKMLTKWKRLSIEAGEGENEWNCHEWKYNRYNWNTHWYVFWDSVSAKVTCGNSTSSRLEGVYFPTAESLLAAIKELGEENVKKYILGVRD